MISILVEPPGVTTETSSPTCLPRRALPAGDSSEIRPLLGAASAEPTIVNASSPYSSWTFTVEPTSTTPLTCLPSVMLAFRTSFSSRRIRPSTKPCSFLASSYSAFSLISPNSFAWRMRSATSGRRLLRSTSSSACKRFRPSCVRYTTLSFSMVAIKSRRIIRDSRRGFVSEKSGLSAGPNSRGPGPPHPLEAPPGRGRGRDRDPAPIRPTSAPPTQQPDALHAPTTPRMRKGSRSGRFTRRRGILELRVEREGARIDRQRRIEYDGHIRGTRDGLDHRSKAGGATKAAKAPRDELSEQARAALGSVIVEHKVAVAPDELDLLDPGERGNGLAGRETSNRLPDQPEVAQDAASQHHGVDAGLVHASDGVVGRSQITAAGDRGVDLRPDMRDRHPVGGRVVA